MAASARFEARDLARIAIFAALIIVLGVAGQIPLPTGVPVTLQTLAVMLAGVVLGPLRGAASVVVVLALAAVGLPVLSGGGGGLGVFVGPSVGYLVGWIPGVIATGLIARAGARGVSWWRALVGAVVGGIAIVYALGAVGLTLVAGLAFGDALVSNVVFLPGDLAKAVVASLLAVALWRAYPPAFAFVRAPRPTEPQTAGAAR